MTAYCPELMIYRRYINRIASLESVSSLDSPLYKEALATFLHKILIKNIPVTDSHLNNSFDLVQKLKDIQVDDDYILISLDAVSLFTNIFIDLAIESVSK